MRHHARKDEKILKSTDNRRVYHILHTVEPLYALECGLCPRYKIYCGRKCNPTRFIKKNWKKLRKFQWKEKK